MDVGKMKWMKSVHKSAESRCQSLSSPSKSKWFNNIKCYENGNGNENEKWWFCREGFSTYYQFLQKTNDCLISRFSITSFFLVWMRSLMLYPFKLNGIIKCRQRSISFKIHWFRESFVLFLSFQLSVQWYYKIK